MKTKTPQQLNEQWKRISNYVRQRGHFIRYYRIYARYNNRMADYNREAVYWTPQNGYHYTERNNAPVPYEFYTDPFCYSKRDLYCE